ncbi:hypothetical protein H8E88_06880 [candidate division KSB1 bacterium]|nr:hypothetical protein [candidate division KSB1 bacterium]
MKENKKNDPIPEHFNSVQDASDFWDSHDAGVYDTYLRPVNEGIEVEKEIPQAVLVEYSIIEKLKKNARKRGISLETLVNLWLVEKLLVEK